MGSFFILFLHKSHFLINIQINYIFLKYRVKFSSHQKFSTRKSLRIGTREYEICGEKRLVLSQKI